tara:strand:+ start:3820 stop:4083 length:264 start_codon:yes stop_codon:yes gene_type:complete
MGNLYLFNPTHLPIDGWLQGCVICSNITGNTKIVSKYKIPFDLLFHKEIRKKNVHGFICKTCKNFKNKQTFYRKCIVMLDEIYNEEN